MAPTPIFLLKLAVLAAFVFASLLALASWAVRSGRLSPFGRLARLARRLGDPVLRPLERRLVRGGANPQDAPLWLFWIVLIGGLLVLGLTTWLIDLAADLSASVQAGPLGILFFLLNGIFDLLIGALFVRVIASWFQISPYGRIMRGILGLTDWIISPLRRIIPPIGMIDLTPMVAFFLLIVARRFLLGLL